MKITKTCILTSVQNTLDLPITLEQYERVVARHETGEYIQDIVPNLNADQREFLMTGILNDTWQERLGEDFEEDN